MGFKADTSKVVASFRKRTLKGRKQLQLDVGYRAPYAVYVHENLTANHPNGGVAKFLETPMRIMSRQLADTTRRVMLQKRSLREGLLRAGNELADASRPLVPVDTGFLRDSQYVRVRR